MVCVMLIGMYVSERFRHPVKRAAVKVVEAAKVELEEKAEVQLGELAMKGPTAKVVLIQQALLPNHQPTSRPCCLLHHR